MSVHLYGAFVLACLLLAVTPGPNMMLFIANGTSYGVKAALLTVFGSTASLSILVIAAALGMGATMSVMSGWFDIIRWAGAAYLVWLGVMRLRAALQKPDPLTVPVVPAGRRWFWQGAVASLSNPKVLLFLGAFFPQFINPAAPIGPQLALLAVTFIVAVASVDFLVAFAAGSAQTWFTDQRRRFVDGVSGLLLVCGGLWLATLKRS